jgi:hypothetical protein
MCVVKPSLDFAAAKPFFAALPKNHIRCGKADVVYFLTRCDGLGSLDQRGLRTRTDMQIGGGMQVSDVFQAIAVNDP